MLKAKEAYIMLDDMTEKHKFQNINEDTFKRYLKKLYADATEARMYWCQRGAIEEGERFQRAIKDIKEEHKKVFKEEL